MRRVPRPDGSNGRAVVGHGRRGSRAALCIWNAPELPPLPGGMPLLGREPLPSGGGLLCGRRRGGRGGADALRASRPGALCRVQRRAGPSAVRHRLRAGGARLRGVCIGLLQRDRRSVPRVPLCRSRRSIRSSNGPQRRHRRPRFPGPRPREVCRPHHLQLVRTARALFGRTPRVCVARAAPRSASRFRFRFRSRSRAPFSLHRIAAHTARPGATLGTSARARRA